MRRHFLAASLFLVIFAGAGEALADETKACTITMKTAIEIALKNNTDLKQAATQADYARVGVLKAKANFYPNLLFTSSASVSQEKALSGNSADGSSRSASALLSSSLNLFNGFADTAAYKRSRLELKSETEALARTKESVVYKTIAKYLQVLTDAELIKVRGKNLAENQELLKKIEAFYEAGSKPVGDLYKQQADTMQAELDLLDAEKSLVVDKLLLSQTIGIDPGADFDVSSQGPDEKTVSNTSYVKKQVLEEALGQRADLAQQKSNIEAAVHGVVEAKAGYYPSVNLSGNIGPSYSWQSGGVAGNSNGNGASASIGLTVSVAIFDRYVTKSNVAQARIVYRQKELVLESLEKEAAVEAGQAVEEFNTTRKQRTVSESQLKYAHETLASTEARYAVGASTLLDLADARAKYVDAEYNVIKARYNLISQAVSVEYSKGSMEGMLKIVSGSEG